jgi:hypothetical protein
VHRFAEGKPKLFSFPALERQITDCVGLRPVLTDPNRKIYLEYGDATPRRLAFEYPIREPLVSKREIKVAGEKGTFWADLTEQPVKQRVGRRARVAGILMRGERAAYEVSRGSNLAGNPVMMTRVVGELRIDSIEDLQRHASNDDQHIYKADRSGLNPEHPLVEGAYKLIDEILGPLIAGLDADEEQTRTTPDMRRELQKLARVINQEIAGASVLGPEDEGGDPVEEPDGGGETDDPPPPPPRPEPIVRELKDPIEFPHGRIFVYAGHSRTIAVWFDGDEIAEGSLVEVVTPVDEFVTQATLSADLVPPAAGDGVAELRLTVKGGNLEGRHEVTVRSGGHVATLPVHVRFPRASGFISQIVTVDQDWEIGSALWDPSTGVVKVYIGRPEFRDAKARASRAGEKVAWRHPEYRQLVVESVREAALWEAAKQKAEVDLDEMSAEDRKEGDAFHNLVRFHFQELDYRLRAKLHKAFAQGGKSG